MSPRLTILSALVRGPAHGLEIQNRIKTLTDGEGEISQGTLYPTLRALEAEGLLKSHKEPGPSERGGRPRIVYELTGAGVNAFNTEREYVIRVLADMIETRGAT